MASASTQAILRLSNECGSLETLLKLSLLSDEALVLFQGFASEHLFVPNQTIFEVGDPSQYWFLISSGVVRKYKTMTDDRRQIIGFSLPGEWIAPSAGDGFSFSADAIDAVKAYSFSRAPLTALLDRRPEILARFHDLAGTQLAAAEEHILLLGRRRSEEKIACFLLTMRERWAQVGKRSITVHLPMSRCDIGDYLGVTTETVSRTLARFAREGIILPVPEGIRLLDVGRLEQRCG